MRIQVDIHTRMNYTNGNAEGEEDRHMSKLICTSIGTVT